MKVLFCVNIPSPYRVDFFNELGKHCDLTVCFERDSSSERDSKWVSDEAEFYKAINLNLRPFSYDRTIGMGLLNYLRKSKADVIVMANYYSPSAMLAISWCRLTGKKFFIEGDGGFGGKDSFLKRHLKRWLILGSEGYFTTCEESIKYLKSLGYKMDAIYKYPFSSVRKGAIKTEMTSPEEITVLKDELGIKEEKVLLSVGRFSYQAGYGKGYDVLLDVAEKLNNNIGVYIVGDNPTEEFIRFKEERNLINVHYIGFKTKDELSKYYKIADCTILLTRGDAWGLVVNESMAYGKPVIASNRCNAALEMIKEGENGHIVDLSDIKGIVDKVTNVIQNGVSYYHESVLATIKRYTIETMVEAHLDAWGIKK